MGAGVNQPLSLQDSLYFMRSATTLTISRLWKDKNAQSKPYNIHLKMQSEIVFKNPNSYIKMDF